MSGWNTKSYAIWSQSVVSFLSYRVNRHTDTQTHRQTKRKYTPSHKLWSGNNRKRPTLDYHFDSKSHWDIAKQRPLLQRHCSQRNGRGTPKKPGLEDAETTLSSICQVNIYSKNVFNFKIKSMSKFLMHLDEILSLNQ